MIRQGADTLQVFHIVLFIIFATTDNADSCPNLSCTSPAIHEYSQCHRFSYQSCPFFRFQLYICLILNKFSTDVCCMNGSRTGRYCGNNEYHYNRVFAADLLPVINFFNRLSSINSYSSFSFSTAFSEAEIVSRNIRIFCVLSLS